MRRQRRLFAARAAHHFPRRHQSTQRMPSPIGLCIKTNEPFILQKTTATTYINALNLLKLILKNDPMSNIDCFDYPKKRLLRIICATLWHSLSLSLSSAKALPLSPRSFDGCGPRRRETKEFSPPLIPSLSSPG